MTLADVPSADVAWERFYPVGIGLAAAAATVAASPNFFSFATQEHWHLEVLYLAGFEFASVATSFLFTFFMFVIAADSGFIAKMKSSIYYGRMIGFTARALALGVILALASLPLMVIQPIPISRWSWETAVVAIWVFIAAWTVGAFVRTVRQFIAFATADL